MQGRRGTPTTDLDVAAQRAAEHVLDLRQPFGKIDDARLQRLPARECQQLPRQALAALGRVGDRVEQLDLLVVLDVAAQPLHAAADDHQQIVEVVGDAAGQLADGLELLRLVQRAFRHFAALGLVVQALGAAQREPQHGEQQQRRRQAEDQMGADGHEPFAVDRRDAGAGERIDRIAGKLAKADAPRHAVDLGGDGEHAVA